jgi:enamine deaminase RidA (YjgF/YER057c/UK114 family)
MLGTHDVDTIRNESIASVCSSVVERGTVRHLFAVALPRRGDTVSEQTEDALCNIEALSAEQGACGSIITQSVFLRRPDDLPACRQVIRDFFGRQMPATTYIFQPPCSGKLVEVEVSAVSGAPGEVSIDRRSEKLVVTHHDGMTWAHQANIGPHTEAKAIYDRSLSTFNLSGTALAAGGFRFEEVIRTWLYLGDIVGLEGETERYRELNRARTDFYEAIRFGGRLLPPGWQKPIFPASTGIGTSGSDLTLSCLALATDRPDVHILPLENPQQTAAFDYAHQYGVKSPKFARAMAVVAGQYATTFVSGTASITASETRYVDDVEGQTQQTLSNIEALVAEANFRHHGMAGMGATLDDLVLARVYVKRQADYATVRAVCQQRLGPLPVAYTIADVCRPELLVEIEAIAFSRKSD